MTKFRKILLGVALATAVTVPVGVGIAVADSGGGGHRDRSGMMSDAGAQQAGPMDNTDNRAQHQMRDQMRDHQGTMVGAGNGMQRGAITSTTS